MSVKLFVLGVSLKSFNKTCAVELALFLNIFTGISFQIPTDNSISNHPGYDTYLSEFFIFAPFVGIIEIWKLWKFQLLTPSGFWDHYLKIWQNTLRGQKSFWIYTFFNNPWSKEPIKLKFGTSKFFGMRSPKITLRIHKNKPEFSYFTF